MCYNCQCDFINRISRGQPPMTHDECKCICASPTHEHSFFFDGRRVVLPALKREGAQVLLPVHHLAPHPVHLLVPHPVRPRRADPPRKLDAKGIWRFLTGWRVNHCWHGEECWSQGVKCNRHHPIMSTWGFRHCRKGVHCANSTCSKVHPPR